jgi:hypothetical protein
MAGTTLAALSGSPGHDDIGAARAGRAVARFEAQKAMLPMMPGAGKQEKRFAEQRTHA